MIFFFMLELNIFSFLFSWWKKKLWLQKLIFLVLFELRYNTDANPEAMPTGKFFNLGINMHNKVSTIFLVRFPIDTERVFFLNAQRNDQNDAQISRPELSPTEFCIAGGARSI